MSVISHIHILPGPKKNTRRNYHKPDEPLRVLTKVNVEIFYKENFHNSPRVLKLIRISKGTKDNLSSQKGSLGIPPRKRLYNENVEAFMK